MFHRAYSTSQNPSSYRGKVETVALFFRSCSPFRRGEAKLPKTCAANVTELATLDRNRLLEKIGTVSAEKLDAILDGVQLLLRSI